MHFAFCVGEAVAQSSPATAKILVMPFDAHEPEPRMYWLGEASAILLADRLHQFGANAISRAERVRVFDRLHLPAVPSVTHATVIRVGHLVGATDVIVGRLALKGDQLSVRARRVRLDTGKMQPELVESGPLSGLFSIFDRLARRVFPGIPATALADPPLDAFEHYVKGLLAENPENRKRYLETAVKLAPRYDPARLALWDVLTELGDHTRALEVLAPVLDSKDRRRARFLAGLSQLELKQHDEAFSTWKALLDSQPSPDLYNNLGVVQLRRGATLQTGRATYYFDKAADADPNDSDYRFNLGYAYWIDRDPPAAIYWLREAVRRNPADGDAHFMLGVALQAAGAGTEAAREKDLANRLSSKYAEWERRATPGSDPVPRGLERVKTELEPDVRFRVDTAIVDTAQREQRELADFHLERGRRLFEQGRDTEAIAELRRAVYLSPYLAESHLLLGRAYLRTGQAADAVAALKIALWSEESAEAHATLAGALLQTGDEAGARSAAERALALDPASTHAKELISRLRKP